MDKKQFKVTYTGSLEDKEKRFYEVRDLVDEAGFNPGDILEITIKKIGTYDLNEDDVG